MPFDALVLSLVVTAVFVGFAGVLLWADRQTRSAQENASAPKRRSF